MKRHSKSKAISKRGKLSKVLIIKLLPLIDWLSFVILTFLPKKINKRIMFMERCFRILRKINPNPLFVYLGSENITPNYKVGQAPSDSKEQAICIRFSGGSDSSLAAANFAEQFRVVHLLTFLQAGRCGLGGLEIQSDGKEMVIFLRNKYGNNKFVHRFFSWYKLRSLSDLREWLFFNNYYKNLLKFGLYVNNLCGVCTLAMHVKVIIYCLENNIKYASDGASYATGEFLTAAQMYESLLSIKDMYKKYGINFLINPGYNVANSDYVLFEKGITPVKDIKTNPDVYYRYQARAIVGSYTMHVAREYYFRIHGKNSIRKVAPQFIKEKIKPCCRYLDNYLDSKNKRN